MGFFVQLNFYDRRFGDVGSSSAKIAAVYFCVIGSNPQIRFDVFPFVGFRTAIMQTVHRIQTFLLICFKKAVLAESSFLPNFEPAREDNLETA